MLSDSKIKRKPKLSSPNKPRKCATVFQVRELETTFERDPRPSHDKRLELADKLDMHPRTVQIWFQNRRAKARSQNHLMVKTVNCSASSAHIPAHQSLPYNLSKQNPLPQFNDLIMPFCLSPKMSDYLPTQGIEGKSNYIDLDDRYRNMPNYNNSTTTTCNFNQSSYLTSPSINSNSPSHQYTPYINNHNNAEILDPWGVPYQHYNNLIGLDMLSPYLNNVAWNQTQGSSLPLDINKFKDNLNPLGPWDSQVYTNYYPESGMHIE